MFSFLVFLLFVVLIPKTRSIFLTFTLSQVYLLIGSCQHDGFLMKLESSLKQVESTQTIF